MTIETICNLLLDALTEAGFNESTLFNYKGVIRRFKIFCAEKGVTDYTPEIGQAYADDVISKKNREIQCPATLLTGEIFKVAHFLLQYRHI